MKSAHITTRNIESYRGTLTIRVGDLAGDIWSVFDRSIFHSIVDARIVPLDQIISIKNQLEDTKFVNGQKPDPRQSALERMREAASGICSGREPLTVEANSNGTYTILDGNATAQVLMLAGWKEVAVQLKQPLHLKSTPHL